MPTANSSDAVILAGELALGEAPRKSVADASATKSDGGKNAQSKEGRQSRQLGDCKRRLRLGRRQGLQCGHFKKELNDQHKEIQVLRRNSGYDVGYPPPSRERSCAAYRPGGARIAV